MATVAYPDRETLEPIAERFNEVLQDFEKLIPEGLAEEQADEFVDRLNSIASTADDLLILFIGRHPDELIWDVDENGKLVSYLPEKPSREMVDA